MSEESNSSEPHGTGIRPDVLRAGGDADAAAAAAAVLDDFAGADHDRRDLASAGDHRPRAGFDLTEPRIQIMQDMGIQPKFREQETNPLFEDDRAMRPEDSRHRRPWFARGGRQLLPRLRPPERRQREIDRRLRRPLAEKLSNSPEADEGPAEARTGTVQYLLLCLPRLRRFGAAAR